MPTLFLLLGNANMYQRFFAARDEREARRSCIGWVVGVMIVETLVITLAVVGSSMGPFRGLEHPETIIPEVARHGLPTVIGCLLLAAIVAIIVSTADSFLLVPATNLVHDVYQRFINPGAAERTILLLSRLAVVLLGALAYILSVSTFKGILEAVLAAYSIYGAAVTPALLAVFFWPRATSRGATASILAGTIAWFIWEIGHNVFLGGETYPLGIETIYTALLASFVALIGVSLATEPQPEKARLFAARSGG
jgi:SSS family solute:Na+ symporter/sodium/proline symporter